MARTTSRSLVVDTGPLFDYLLLGFTRRVPDQRFRTREIEYRDDAAGVDRLFRFFNRCTSLLTAPETLVEVHYLFSRPRGRCPDPTPFEIEMFWRFTLGVFLERGVQEELIPLLKHDPATLVRVGPTDSSVLMLAVRHGATLVTIEGPKKLLPSLCAEHAVRCVFLREIVDGSVE